MALVLVVSTGTGAFAQRAAPFNAPRAHLGVAALASIPTGEFEDHTDAGWGLGAALLYRPTEARWFAVRMDGGYINYGGDREGDCPDDPELCASLIERSVTSNILYAGVGPQLVLPGGPIRPYAALGVGVGYFATTLAVETAPDAEQFESESLLDDLALRWSAAGGLLAILPVRAFPIALDLGARYHGTSAVRYLPEVDLADDVGSVDSVEGTATFVTVRLGIFVGIPR